MDLATKGRCSCAYMDLAMDDLATRVGVRVPMDLATRVGVRVPMDLAAGQCRVPLHA
jgi:hypothetical protein